MDKIKILVVDDESRMRKLVRDFLEREGFQVLEAGDGLEAMEVFYGDKGMSCRVLSWAWTNISQSHSVRRFWWRG